MDIRTANGAERYLPSHSVFTPFLLLLALLLSSAVNAAQLNIDDDTALAAFYNATGGASWTNSTGWSGSTGVMDDTTNRPFGVSFNVSGRVSGISLGYNNLVGDISTVDFSAMTGLTRITLYGNNLSSLPAAASLPGSLQHMEISGSQVSGAFPDYSTLTSLVSLYLQNNSFTGNLPAAALLPPNLQLLHLPYNQYSGSVPDYSGMSSITTLTLQSNQLSGSLPTAATLPPNVRYLSLSSNQFTGSVLNYSTLPITHLYLTSNLLSGTLPLATQLPAGLQYLELGSNQFTGVVPDYSGLTSLTWLTLTNNQVSGSLPDASKLPTALTTLYIESNQFTGTIPDYSSLPLGKLYLSNNQLSGGLPSAAQLPATVQDADLSGNLLTGSIPDYSSMAALQYLSLNGNQLDGSLPPVAQLPPGIIGINFSSNNLSGTIPDYSTSATLTSYTLTSLNIQGPMPPGLSTLFGFLTTSPAIDPALEGSGQPAGIITVSGTGSEIGATVNLYLDGASVASGISVGGVGEWSGTIDLSGKTQGSYLLTATSTYNAWPGYPYTRESAVPSTAITIKVDTTAPVITLVGPATQTVAQGASYTDLGVTVTDNVDTGLIATVTGSVDTSTVGTYFLTYDVSDNAGNAATPVVRTVNVTDQTAPVITLLGSNPVSVTQGDTFTDPGATVSDNVDTGLTATVTGSVDTSTPGSYILTYNASDTTGNPAIAVTRTVNVVTPPSSSGGGGGSIGWMFLLLLLVLYFEPKRAKPKI